MLQRTYPNLRHVLQCSTSDFKHKLQACPAGARNLVGVFAYGAAVAFLASCSTTANIAYHLASQSGMLTYMASEQIAVRLPEPLLSDLDELVNSGAYESRAAAVRAGIEAIMKLELQRRTDRAMVNGYKRQPPTETEEHAALASLREAILDEPW